MPFSSPVTSDALCVLERLAAKAGDIEVALRSWAARPPSCARTVVLDVLLDIKLRLEKDET